LSINQRNATDQMQWRANEAIQQTVANSNRSGLIAMSRISATSTAVYRNGALIGSSASTSNAWPNGPC
jgi:hypothetical protein